MLTNKHGTQSLGMQAASFLTGKNCGTSIRYSLTVASVGLQCLMAWIPTQLELVIYAYTHTHTHTLTLRSTRCCPVAVPPATTVHVALLVTYPFLTLCCCSQDADARETGRRRHTHTHVGTNGETSMVLLPCIA